MYHKECLQRHFRDVEDNMTEKIAMKFIRLAIIALLLIMIPASAAYSIPVVPSYNLEQGKGIIQSAQVSIPDNHQNQPLNLEQNSDIRGINVELSSSTYRGNYLDTTSDKVDPQDDRPFVGGATVQYTINPDNTITGTADYKFVTPGWTINKQGTISGKADPVTGSLQISSNQDADITFLGEKIPIEMNINAKDEGKGFEGTKTITLADLTVTLGFHGKTLG